MDNGLNKLGSNLPLILSGEWSLVLLFFNYF